MAESIPPGNIEAHIQGEISGQVAVGNYILQIGSIHGGVVNVAPPEKQFLARPRPTPVFLRPRRFPGLLDRNAEVNSATVALQSALPVEFYGQAGLGKTTLLRHLAYHSLTNSFRDGVVYLLARNQPVVDLLQSLFDAFYESDTPFKPTDGQVRHALQNKQALVLLDDLELARDEVEGLMDAAPGCTFLSASPERRLWGEVRAIALRGLPLDNALALVERELERPLTSDERLTAQTLCTALDGHPLHILQAVAMAREKDRSLADVAQLMKSASPAEALTDQISSLPEPERRVLAALAVMGGTPVHAQHLTALAELPNTEPILETLLRRGLVQAHEPRYSLAGALNETLKLKQAWDMKPWIECTLTYFKTWAEQNQRSPDRLLEESDTILQALELAVGVGYWADVLKLGRIIEDALVLGKRWGVWAQVLQLMLQAARALGDQSAKAFALHQIGTRALCLGDTSTAQTSLTQALHLRESLGDRIGAEVTRHNLNLIPGLPVSSKDDRQTRDDSKGLVLDKGVSPLIKGALAIMFLGLIGLGIWYFLIRPKPVVGLEPGSLDFVNQEIGTSKEQTITLTNSGSGSLRILSVTLTGTDLGDFAITADSCSNATVSPNNSCTIRISFTPTAEGSRSASLTITGNARNSPQNVLLSGTGIPRAFPFVNLNPTRLDFGNQEVGESREEKITLTNSGSAPLNISSLTLTNTDNFTKTNDTCSDATIAPNNSCDIVIGFVPTAEGSHSATLTITDNASDSPQTVGLEGTGTVSPPVVNISPSSLDFESQEVDTSSKVRTVTLTNKGPGSLTISSITLTGSDAGDFTITYNSCSNATIAPDNSCAVSISFTPTARESRNANLTITDNAVDSPQSVPLSGTGTAVPIVSFNPDSLDFGDQEVGVSSEEQTVIITNKGSALLKISEVTLTGTYRANFETEDNCSDTVIAPSESCTIRIRFTPTAEGSCRAKLTIIDNAADSPQSVPLSGAGTASAVPLVSLNPTSLDFGLQEVDTESKAQMITLTNKGSAPLKISDVTLTGAYRANFKTDDTCSDATIAPGESCTITISLTPRGRGNFSTNLVITDNAADSPQSVPLTWSGIVPPGWCCSDGEVFHTYREDCRGYFSYRETEARRRCQPGWCCINYVNLEKSDSDTCEKQDGKFYTDYDEARKYCVERGYCCINGDLDRSDSRTCARRRGKFYTDPYEAKRYCVDYGYCCQNGKLFRTSKENCEGYFSYDKSAVWDSIEQQCKPPKPIPGKLIPIPKPIIE